MTFTDLFDPTDLGVPDDWEEFDQSLGLPTIHNCDLGNPRQVFLWCFVGLPGVVGAPLVFPIEYWELVSFHMVELGLRLAADPIKKYRPTTESMLQKSTAAGTWVGMDEVDPEPTTLADVTRAQVPADQRAELRGVMLDKLGFPEGAEDVDMPVSELATRLKVNVDRLVMVLADYGIENITVDSTIDRVVAERLVAHMGL
ncbi:hypothetical protein CH296_00355 [Rhodococcus sp. 14-2496-1d]|uniref:translation initiation factor IF-2 N-terminal domain-containing protein n=1 Tax=Rhodococcus sp. 14-2496-1d TaxID=2023146 RepID=UPI000B9BCF46|nr:translation initiation factor IF-2 N-terminal domain-containing protein [Rhodococcus sp. 14-2496-1d]OZF40743.1 hypothetical protein CH296_00355 [Rhodococcus sp. 14-2496-1d]